MLIAISGPQGSGKSTILQKLKELGYPIVERKTARSILTEWNIGLEEIYSCPVSTQKFQDILLARKYADDAEIKKENHEVCFTERTFSDLFTYTVLNLGNKNSYSEYIAHYYDQCMAYSQELYAGICYVPTGLFKIEDDKIRPNNQHYADIVAEMMFTYTRKMRIDYTMINECDLDKRVDVVLQYTESLKEKVII